MLRHYDVTNNPVLFPYIESTHIDNLLILFANINLNIR